MSTRQATRPRAAASRAKSGRSGRRASGKRVPRWKIMRRRLMVLAAAVLAGLAITAVMTPWLDRAVKEISLPLRHDDIIRQQARDKNLDPALIAAVIYTESHFRDQTSPAGAKGLMQILPRTADYIAHLSGGTEFEQGDLATPQINIAYGSWYLQYLKRKYRGSDVLALAAYNAGEGKLDEWLAGASARGETFDVASHIPFPETRSYVTKVLRARDQYRREYPRELRV